MHARALRSLCAIAAGCLLATQWLLAGQTASTPAPDSQSRPARTDYPDWPWPRAGAEPPRPGEGELFHIPGSTKSYTDTQINRSTSTVDWFPDLHPPPPAPVIAGKNGAYRACGQCHLIDGRGKPDTADLRGLPVAYVLQQLADMREGRRRGSVPRATIKDMIPIAKAIDDADAGLAAEYFLSIPAAGGIRVVETNTVPVTRPGPHGVQMVDAGGATEPIGMRIIEVPEDARRTLLRDATSGFVAYVPKGSIKRGEMLARTGDGGRTLPCAGCHGAGLKGMGELFPPLAGHSPSATARQLYDFQSGARDGRNALAMKPVVANLTDRDIVDLTAYIVSLQPRR